jgi:ribosome-associated heat shock protein Hsp15
MTGQRIDKWLWSARFFKTRALAARACHDGRIRVSGQVLTKAHYAIKVGDVLTFPLGPNIRVVRVVAFAARRGPAAEARGLYEDLAPPGGTLPVREGELENGGAEPRAAARRPVRGDAARRNEDTE